MPNNVLPEGDDIKWKKEVDRVIADLLRRIEFLEKQKAS